MSHSWRWLQLWEGRPSGFVSRTVEIQFVQMLVHFMLHWAMMLSSNLKVSKLIGVHNNLLHEK